jgi:hypothetical protein
MLDKDYNVVPHKYYTQQLHGNDTHRLLKNHAGICAQAATIFKDPQLRKADCSETDADIDAFLKKISDLLCVFEAIYMLWSKTVQLSPEELAAFAILSSRYVDLWRSCFPGESIPPKLHLIETHARQQMQMFGCLGDKIESPVERLHKRNNHFHRLLSPVKKWSAKQSIMVNWVDKAEMAEVVEAKRLAIERTARVMSPQTVLRKRAQAQVEEEVNRAKVEHAIHIINALNPVVNN